jgi:hypothetical protein
MCSLCGMLEGQVHWTESKGPATGAHAQWRERQARVRLVNTVLQHYGLTLAEWSGKSYVLSSRTGRTAIVVKLNGSPVGAVTPWTSDCSFRLNSRAAEAGDGRLHGSNACQHPHRISR